MKLMVLDGNSVINRAYYGVRALTTKDGFFTNAIYGFLNILEKLRTEEQPDALCVTFDLKAPTFRHLAYDGYKATRHPMPDELAMQLPMMKDILRAMRIPIFECEGWEADDVIGTIGKQCGRANWDCVIVTGDRDSLQLIDEHVTVKLVSSKLSQSVAVNYDPARFREEYGFDPIHLIDLKALMGDSSDNIPGVAGVGPKTATQLLLDYGTLDGIYAHLDAIKDKLRAKLEQGRESAYMSYDLATIRCEAPIDFSPEDCRVQQPDNDTLYQLFTRLEFTRQIARYGLHAPQETVEAGTFAGTCTSETVTDAARAAELAAAFQKEHYVNIIAEPDLSGIAVETGESGYYFSDFALSDDFMLTIFGASVKKVTHDCKPLMRRLLEQGYPAEGFIFDTALAAYDLDATRGSYDLDSVVQQHLGFAIGRADSEQVGKDAARVCSRLAEAAAVGALYEALPEKLTKNGMEKLYYEIELPLCRVLAEMEAAGVKADQMALISFGNMLQSRIEAAEQTIFGYAGKKFNINSTKQLGQILFDELSLPAGKKTKSGYSTNADVLEKLRGKHPIIDAILDFRAMTKLKSTYADGLVKQIADDGRIHTTFQNMVTATGRLSSTDPNLQNIPVRTERGKLIRAAVVPRDAGHLLVSADYSQIELRIMAAMSGDESMLDAFAHGADIHRETAARVYDVMPALVTDDMRRTCKMVNFGIIYGISAFGLSQRLHIPRKEAAGLIDTYFRLYPKIRAFMDTSIAKAREAGYAVTALGRRRTLRDIASRNATARQSAERDAINTPIQGTAADLIKLAMVKVDRALKAADLRAKMILQIHDELLFDVPKDEVEQVKALAKREMEGAMSLGVPLDVSVGVGANWLEAH